jgi:hypothetical protein
MAQETTDEKPDGAAARRAIMKGTKTSWHVRRLWLLGAAAWLAACGGGSDGNGGNAVPPPASPVFELRLDSTSVPVLQGSGGLLRVQVERQAGFGGAIELQLADPPAGVGGSAVVVEPYQNEAQLPLRIGDEVPLGTLGIVVSGAAGTETATTKLQLDVQAPQPKTQQLIQAALDAGQIDLGTSLVYRAQAAFGDSRLPETFVGSGPAEEDIALFADIEDARPKLPQSILDQLAPYLARPDDPASVFNEGQPTQRERPTATPLSAVERCTSDGTRQWITSRSTLHPVRAWALCVGAQSIDEAAQNDLAKVIGVVDKAYEKMLANMGPAKPDLVGDEAIDVYVVNSVVGPPRPAGPYRVGDNRGAAWPQAPYAGNSSSGFIVMPAWRLAEADYQLTLIHELFHVLQFAHNYRLARHWFTEASATWSSFHFNRTAEIRHADNKSHHEENFGGFQADSHSLLSTGNLYHPYQSYIWPLFMEQDGDASMIGDAWRQFGNLTTFEQATNALDFLLPFKDYFRKFAVRNWNEALLPGDPIGKRYKALDDPFPDAGQYPPKAITARALAPARPLSLPAEIEALAAKYFRFEVEASSGIQSVEFDFNGLSGREHLSVDALIRNADGWVAKPVSLDGEPKPIFCFDLGPSSETVRGSFVELRLVLSNHGHVASNRVGGNLQVGPSRGGCAGWTGEIRWSNLTDVPGVQRNEVSTVASVTFKVDENPPGGSTAGVVPHKVSRGHLTYRAELTMPSCHQLATAQVEMNPDATSGPGATVASLTTFSTNGVPQYGSHSGATFGEITVTGNCTADGSQTTVVHPNQLIPWWTDPAGKPAYDLKENGTLMQEDVSVSSDHGGARSQWTLRKTGP